MRRPPSGKVTSFFIIVLIKNDQYNSLLIHPLLKQLIFTILNRACMEIPLFAIIVRHVWSCIYKKGNFVPYTALEILICESIVDSTCMLLFQKQTDQSGLLCNIHWCHGGHMFSSCSDVIWKT